MKIRILVAIYVFISLTLSAQNTVKLTYNYGSENKEISDLIDFQNIFIEKLNFESENIKNKYYEINIEEFKDGKSVKKTLLFDGKESEYFKIDSTAESIKFFFQMSNGDLKAYARGQKYGSKKVHFKLLQNSDKYALKDFFGSKKELNESIDKEFAIFAIITPTMHKDGSGSYCEVVQSDIKPENLGKHFKIPHYFLVTMKFK